MSDERIDLTQFEGITEGEWCYYMDAEWHDTEWYNDLTNEVPEDKRAEYAENTRKAYEKGQKDGLEPYLSPLIEQNGYGGDYSTFGVRIFRGLLRGNEQDEFTTSDKIRPIPTPSEIRANARAIAAVPDLIAELKRCYELIDDMQGNVPYVEHCEECGASDGFQTEGCGDCGIIHYQTSRGLRGLHGYTWGFFHKDSPLWEKYR